MNSDRYVGCCSDLTPLDTHVVPHPESPSYRIVRHWYPGVHPEVGGQVIHGITGDETFTEHVEVIPEAELQFVME